MAVLSCGVVLVPLETGCSFRRRRARRARGHHGARPRRRRAGPDDAGRGRHRHPARLGGTPGAPRPAPRPLLGRGRDRTGLAGHPLLGRRGRLLRRPAPIGRGRQRRVRHPVEPHLGRSGRVRHEITHRHLLQRLRIGLGQRQGRQELLRRPGARRVLLRRDHREARRRPLPHQEGRLHHLRPADPALGGDRQHRHAGRRQARHPQERRPEGQGRAAVLRAGDVLPDQQGGSVDRLPDAGLRHLDDPRLVAQQRLLLGDQPQPGPHADARLVHPDRPGLRRRVPLRGVGGLERRVPDVPAERARHHVPAGRPGHHPAGAPELRDPHQRGAGAAGRLPRPRQRRLLQRRHRPAAVPAGPLQPVAADPELPGQRLGRARQGQLDQRHLRHQRDLLRRRRLADHRRPTAHPVQSRPDQARSAAALRHRRRRVRQHRPLQHHRRRQERRPEPDPPRRQPVAAVPADEVAVPLDPLVAHLAQHLLDREAGRAGAGQRAAVPPGTTTCGPA